jgi:hypothetical protein
VNRRPAGRLLSGAALLACVLAAPGDAGTLEIVAPGGDVLARLAVQEGAEWCLHWHHSVTGGAVADCFEFRAGRMMLTRSYLHDFAAGLGHIPGRGVQRSAEGGGYWIDAIDEPVPGNALSLRVGSPEVGHRIIAGAAAIDLWAIAAGGRVILRPANEPTPCGR